MVIQKVGFWNWTLVILFVIWLPHLCEIAALYSAQTRKVFEQYEVGNQKFILVARNIDTLVFSEIVGSRLGGNVLLLKVPPDHPIALQQVVYRTGILEGSSTVRLTLKEWLQEKGLLSNWVVPFER